MIFAFSFVALGVCTGVALVVGWLIFTLEAHLHSAEYVAKTALKRDVKEAEDEEHVDEYLSAFLWIPVFLKDLFLAVLVAILIVPCGWIYLLLYWHKPTREAIWNFSQRIKSSLEYRVGKIKRDAGETPKQNNTALRKVYDGAKKYEKGWFAASLAYLFTRKSKVSKGLGAAALASVGVRKKREIERKKLTSEREQREAEQRAEREKLAQLQKMEDDLRIRAYPDEAPPVIGGENETEEQRAPGDA